MNKLHLKNYIDNTIHMFHKMHVDELYDIISTIDSAIHLNSRIYIIGNGGSASIASHFATDLVHSLGADAICLSDNVGLVTAIGNDNGFENIFSNMLYKFGINSNSNELLIAFSCSGKSPNILNAIDMANKMAMDIIFISGITKESEYANYHLQVPSIDPYTIEGVFSLLCHSIVSNLKEMDD